MKEQEPNAYEAYLRYLAMWQEFYLRNVYLPWLGMMSFPNPNQDEQKEEK